jgi:MOSC domain-containing protein YiiM
MSGRIEAIWIKRHHGGPMDAVGEATLDEERGLLGDANEGAPRQVTVLDKAAWDAATAALGVTLDPALRRANILISGVPLQGIRGRRLLLGDCAVRIRNETRPCTLMDEMHPGLQAALAVDWRGGSYGVVARQGVIRVGDPVRWDEQEDA